MQRTDIQPEQLIVIDKAVHVAFPGSEWSPVTVLGGGLSTSTLYQIAIGTGSYVARLSGTNDRHNNLVQEYAAMALAAEQGIAPRLYHADPQTGVTLSAFVQGQPLFRPNGEGPLLAPMLARLVRTLHQGPAFAQGHSLFGKVDSIFSWLPPAFQGMSLLVQAMASKRKLEMLLNDPRDLRPCHCDINPGNLLFDGAQLWLVDWAAAGQENFYFDLASCTNFFFFQSEAAEQAFLQAYFERPLTATEAEKYAQMRVFCAIYYGLIFLYISSLRGAVRLHDEEITTLPDYPHFMARIGQGQENLGNAISQQRLGFIYLKRAVAMSSQATVNHQ